MTTTSQTIVQRLWNYCNLLRDDGMSYGDYVEQLTYLLFLKMAYERTRLPHPRTTHQNTTGKALLKRAERLRQSILREAFAGQLVPQDPNDEPASVLLEQIQREREERKKMGSVGNGRFVRVDGPVKINVSEMQQVELWE